MQVTVGTSTLELVEGDITNQDVDAIVNAANSRLAGGGGVDGAIHRAGGPEIMAACRRIGGCPTGDSVITTGGKLPAKHVIHTVGPVFRDGTRGEPQQLAAAYRRSLEVALENGVQRVAFPSLSTGAYGYPMDQAARIALQTVVAFLREHAEIELVRFVLFGREAYGAFEAALKELTD